MFGIHLTPCASPLAIAQPSSKEQDVTHAVYVYCSTIAVKCEQEHLECVSATWGIKRDVNGLKASVPTVEKGELCMLVYTAQKELT